MCGTKSSLRPTKAGVTSDFSLSYISCRTKGNVHNQPTFIWGRKEKADSCLTQVECEQQSPEFGLALTNPFSTTISITSHDIIYVNFYIYYVTCVFEWTDILRFLLVSGAFCPVGGALSTGRGACCTVRSGVSHHWIYLWPKGAVPQALTLLGGVRFIAWRLRHPYNGNADGNFGSACRVWATALRPDSPKKRPCALFVRWWGVW